MQTMNETIAALEAQAEATWPGEEGLRRAARVRALLDRMLPEYAAALGMTPDAVLAAIEGKRNYNAVNFYQESNFPPLHNVTVFDTLDGFRAAYPSGRYTCPSCDGISTNPYECNAGTARGDETPCDWKAYGLFGTLGKGLRLVVREKFLDHPRVAEIFMPIEAAEGGRQ